VDIVEAPRTVAHRAIEEAMLAANRAVAEALGRAEIPALYRIHEPPDPGKMEALVEILARFGLLPRGAESPGPREIGRALARVEGRPEARLVHLVALRSLKQARYHAEDRGHFALAFEHYTHFTSPIRRYADLVVHRALKDWMARDLRAARARADALPSVALRVSGRERAAMDAEREIVAMKKAAFLKGHVGESCEGTVTGVAAFGLWVTLDPWFADGLLHVSRLPDRMHFDERSHALVAARSGRRFALGDRLRVRIDSVDLVRAWVTLGLEGDTERRRPARDGASRRPKRQPAASARTASRASSSAPRRSHSR
jgi:ribonuclease R